MKLRSPCGPEDNGGNIAEPASRPLKFSWLFIICPPPRKAVELLVLSPTRKGIGISFRFAQEEGEGQQRENKSGDPDEGPVFLVSENRDGKGYARYGRRDECKQSEHDNGLAVAFGNAGGDGRKVVGN